MLGIYFFSTYYSLFYFTHKNKNSSNSIHPTGGRSFLSNLQNLLFIFSRLFIYTIFTIYSLNIWQLNKKLQKNKKNKKKMNTLITII